VTVRYRGRQLEIPEPSMAQLREASGFASVGFMSETALRGAYRAGAVALLEAIERTRAGRMEHELLEYGEGESETFLRSEDADTQRQHNNGRTNENRNQRKAD
jgi:hypothetical protein